MTNKEALQSLVPFASNNLLEKVLIDRGINSSSTYSASNSDDIELCSAYVIQGFLNNPSYSEGGLSVNINHAELRKTMNMVFEKFGLVGGSVIDGSNIW